MSLWTEEIEYQSKGENPMNNLQISILQIMESIHAICEKEKITYYMVGGTMLGAVRHQGFIPWDDDIDISMPRPDFERFISIQKKDIPDWMEIIPPERGMVNMGYAKVVNKNTTIVEDYKGIRVGGVFIDVFPLDGIADSYSAAKRRLKLIKMRTFMLRANQGLSRIDSIPRKVMAFIAKNLSKEWLYRWYYAAVKKKNFYGSKFVANTVGVYEIKELTEKRIYGTPQLFPFENRRFYGVEFPDEFLKGLYGDYMTLPPKEKRVSQHGVIHLDLNKPYRDYLNERGS